MRAAHLVEPSVGGCRVTSTFDVRAWLSLVVKSMYGKLIANYVATEAASLKRCCEKVR